MSMQLPRGNVSFGESLCVDRCRETRDCSYILPMQGSVAQTTHVLVVLGTQCMEGGVVDMTEAVGTGNAVGITHPQSCLPHPQSRLPHPPSSTMHCFPSIKGRVWCIVQWRNAGRWVGGTAVYHCGSMHHIPGTHSTQGEQMR